MTIETIETNRAVRPIIVARDVPPEVQDSGKVRMGAGIKCCWLTWELFQHLPWLMRYWPDSSC
jgi:hypothetical protein